MYKIQVPHCAKVVVALLLVCQLAGCVQKNKQDPLEKLNRRTYAVNKALDRVIIKPVAQAYVALIPKFVRIPVSNFFQNLSEVPNIFNDMLQGEFSLARHDAARFVLNTTWGIGGILDAAAFAGLERHQQDFGITLARWGYKNSVYFVIPLLGPSTIRDGVGRVATFYMSVPAYLRNVALRNSLYITNAVVIRSDFLNIEPALGEAVDEYAFIRNAYLQNRQYQINGQKLRIDGQKPNLEGPPD